MCRCMRRASLGMLPHTVLTRFARASRPSWSDLDNCRIRGAWNMSSCRFEQAPPLYLPSLVMPSMRLVARSRNGFFPLCSAESNPAASTTKLEVGVRSSENICISNIHMSVSHVFPSQCGSYREVFGVSRSSRKLQKAF